MNVFSKVLNFLVRGFFLYIMRKNVIQTEHFSFYGVGAYERARRLGFGKGTRVYLTAIIYGRPKVGKNVFIGPYTVIDGTGPLVVGDDCQISLHAMIWTHSTHPWCLMGETARGKKKMDGVTIENNVWIGAGAVITPGVRVGNHSMIAAGAVVTEDVPPYSLVAGVPAKVVRSIVIKNKEVKYEPV